MQAFAGIFFEVDAGDADFLFAALAGDLDETKLGEWLVVLRDLVSLGQVGIEIILAGEDRGFVDAAVQGHGCQRGEFDRFLV